MERGDSKMWKYKIGTVVKHDPEAPSWQTRDYGWGHVTGFAVNALGETVLVVKWSDGKEFPIHTSNVLIEGDEE